MWEVDIFLLYFVHNKQIYTNVINQIILMFVFNLESWSNVDIALISKQHFHYLSSDQLKKSSELVYNIYWISIITYLRQKTNITILLILKICIVLILNLETWICKYISFII